MKGTRAYKCGRQAGETLVEMANLFYQLDTRRRFFKGLLDVIKDEDKAVAPYNPHEKKRGSK